MSLPSPFSQCHMKKTLSPESQDRSNNNHSLRHNGSACMGREGSVEVVEPLTRSQALRQAHGLPTRGEHHTRSSNTRPRATQGLGRSHSHGQLSLSKPRSSNHRNHANSVFHYSEADCGTKLGPGGLERVRSHAVPNGCRVSVARLPDSAISRAVNVANGNNPTTTTTNNNNTNTATSEKDTMAADAMATVTMATDNGYKLGSYGNISQSGCQGNSGRSTPTATVTLTTAARFQAGRASSVQSSDSEQKTEDLATCRWRGCGESLDSCALTDHLKWRHVEPQHHQPRDADSPPAYVCKWEGCKVLDKASCSRSWLDRHILTHSGEKPFRCIVDGCGQRFSSQFLLERHVNAHFNQDSGRIRRDDTPSKHLKKKKAKRKFIIPGTYVYYLINIQVIS